MLKWFIWHESLNWIIVHTLHISLLSLRQLFMGDTEADIDAWREQKYITVVKCTWVVCQSKECKMTCFDKCIKCTNMH